MEKQYSNKRMANIEFLRIIAMLMVVMLHYLYKGEVLPSLTESMPVNGYVAWILESLSIVAVNVYVLISGFFLVESGFRCRRLVRILCQVLFYSLLIPIVLLAFGVLRVENIEIYDLLRYILPTQMEHYWFATIFITMYLLSPILGMAVRYMSKRQLKYTIIILLLFFSVNKSLLPVRLEMDNLGYDGIWFLCVYLIAAYIRLHGIPFFNSAKKSLWCYLGGCAGIFTITFITRALFLRAGILELVLGAAYEYNHILNIFGAISLFYAFYHCEIRWKRLANLVIGIAPYTFGVYLLHEHLELRFLWPGWLGAHIEESMWAFILRCIFGVILVFCIGILADMIRGMLFWFIGGFLVGGRIDKLFTWVDHRMGGFLTSEKKVGDSDEENVEE